jgi:putative ABC transport system permease protein
MSGLAPFLLLIGIGVIGLLLILVIVCAMAITSGLAGMFSLDNWQELFGTLRRNKLRTALTAISVAWGIFMLVLLLGLGRGLDQGMRHKFAQQAINSIFIRSGKLSKVYGGYQIGRRVQFNNGDFNALDKIDGVVQKSARMNLKTGGPFNGGTLMIRHGTKANAFDIEPVHPDQLYLDASAVSYGRFLNELDITAKRKSVVLGEPVADFLFGKDDPIGQWVDVAGVPFQVVGVFNHDHSQEQERMVYIPVTSAQVSFNGADHLNSLAFAVGDANGEESNRIAKDVVAELAKRHQFDPDDTQAVRVFNNVENFERFARMFFMIAVFVWFVGGSTILAGVIGVSNIMMITVKERTKEIGVRKALGATSWSIITMITQEAIFLTTMAGFLGLVAGVGVLELAGHVLPPDGFVRNPEVDLSIGVAAGVVLIVFGALAGYFPARAAARVNPIEALRDQ